MKSKIKNSLVYRYQLGQCSEKEKRKVEKWLFESEDNRKIFEHIKKISNAAVESDNRIIVDTERAWRSLRNRMEESERRKYLEIHPINEQRFLKDKTTKKQTRKRSYGMVYGGRDFGILLRIAAILLLSVGLGSMVYYMIYQPLSHYTNQIVNNSDIHSVQANYDEILHFKLPDETLVTLNSKSQLSWAADFNSESRNVHLQGEAYFQVESQDELPFEVTSKEARIRVFGTSFNVSSWEDQQETEVIVVSGLVGVSEISKTEFTMLGENSRALIKKNNRLPDITSVIPDVYLCWLEGKICFNEAPLSKVFAQLERRFNVTIELDKNEYAKEELVTAQYKDESLEEILEIMSFTHHIDYRFYNEDKVRIDIPSLQNGK